MFEYLSNCEIPYRGVLYVGLMITEEGEPNVVEFNVRFGDPECQITLPLIRTDLFDLLMHAATDSLKDLEVQFHNAFALTVVLASEGYPASSIKGRNIDGLNSKVPIIEVGSNWINFAGVKKSGDNYLASGGRVLSCSAMSDSLANAAELAYDLIESISLEGSHYRTDIGGKAL
jgi:phosphoribosylamine--glycine ligase